MEAPVPIRILHAHSTFSLGGKEARAARLMNAFGKRAHHVVLSAMPGQLGARDAVDSAVVVDYPRDAPSLAGRPGLARYLALAEYMRGFDLVLTYNWGAMDVVMAHRLFRRTPGMPPLIHHEDGFNADESQRRNWKRNLFRRMALKTAEAVVVPSQTLARIARTEWKAGNRLQVIANGIDCTVYAQPPSASIPGYARQADDIVIGTIAGLREVKNLPLLVTAVARLQSNVDLVIAGEGPERDAIEQAAQRAGMADRVHLPGFLADPRRYVGHFDIFALSSLSEQAPISLIEAMAAGRPVVATDVGDIRNMLPAAQHRYLVASGDGEALTAALQSLAHDADLRQSLGSANCDHARSHFNETAMIAAYQSLYSRALGSESVFS